MVNLLRDKFIPVEKMSKKQQREYYKSKRKGWGLTKPFTKVEKSTKIYKRGTKHDLMNWQEYEN